MTRRNKTLTCKYCNKLIARWWQLALTSEQLGQAIPDHRHNS